MSLFNRKANVIITNPEVGDESLQLQISRLRTEFDVKKTESSDPNKAVVGIYNLSQSTRNLIDKTDSLLTLYAGYEDGPGLSIVFKGDITNVSHKYAPPEVITVIEASDGENNIQDKRISLSYSGSVSMRQVLSDTIKRFGFAEQLAFSGIAFNDVILNNGYAFVGKIKTVMDEVCKILSLQWSIQNNELKLYQEDLTDETIVINLSPQTGLIGSPEQIKIKTGKKKTDIKQLDGWKIKSLLQPVAEPGGRVNLTSKVLTDESEFKILNVNHSGDTHGSAWQTEIEAISV